MKSVFIVAGEASGDQHAANLVKHLRALDEQIQFRGMGGDNMRAAGVDTLVDIAELAVVGIVEVLASYGKLKAALNTLKQALRESPPDLLILVDYQEFNQRLAAYAKSIGVRVLFYISPQVWAWRPKRVYKMGKIVDHMAVIFPFEVPLYEQAGVPVTFTGHPLVDDISPDKTTQQARRLLGLDDQLTIGLFPGSRKVEIARLLPVQLEAAALLRQQYPKAQFVLPLASTIGREQLQPFQPQLEQLKVHIIENNMHDVIQACDVIIVTSGTATLEIGLYAKPMVIVHKIAPLSYWILRRLVKLEHIGLVNIVPGKPIVKEYIQHEATPQNIAGEVRHILEDARYNQTMREELAKLRGLLGAGGGSQRVAQLAYDMLQSEQQ